MEPNTNNIVLDFDGTLVLENSSRIFENIVFTYNKSMTRYFIYIIFFSDVSKIFNKIFAFIPVISFRKIDYRLLMYIYMSKMTIITNFEKIMEEVTSNLALNKELYNECKDKKVTILSRGISIIIEKFLIYNNIKYDKMVGSNMEINGDKISFGILSFEDKVNYLINLNNFIYYTDSMNEGRYICKKLKIDNMIIDKNLFIIKHS